MILLFTQIQKLVFFFCPLIMIKTFKKVKGKEKSLKITIT